MVSDAGSAVEKGVVELSPSWLSLLSSLSQLKLETKAGEESSLAWCAVWKLEEDRRAIVAVFIVLG